MVAVAARKQRSTPEAGSDSVLSCNEVRIVGRLSRAAEQRELPSGDVLVAFVVVVDRPPAARSSTIRPQTHDSLDCVAWTAQTRRRALALEPGDVVEVLGAVRRRFWTAGVAKASRYEVEAASVKRLARGSTP